MNCNMGAGIYRFRVFILLSLFLRLELTSQIGARQRYFKFEHVGTCPRAPTNIGKIGKLVVHNPNRNHYYLDSEITFLKNITGPVTFHIRSIRCSIEVETECGMEFSMQFSVCEHLNDANALWTPFLKSIEPQFLCPIQMGTYSIRNGTVDFSTLARLPLDGYRYSVNLKFFEMTKSKALEILCLDVRIAIITGSNNPKRKSG